MTSLFLLLHPWLHKLPKGSLHQILPSCSSCMVNGFVRKDSGSHVQYREYCKSCGGQRWEGRYGGGDHITLLVTLGSMLVIIVTHLVNLLTSN